MTLSTGPVHADVLIAEDEPLLAAEMTTRLGRVWPEARVVARVADGLSAVEEALRHRPDVCILDIRMPGQSGLEAARAIVEDWPAQAGPWPLVVFATAYDQHALAAFEAHASDYLLKPVTEARLQRTVQMLQQRLAERRAAHSAASGGSATADPSSAPNAELKALQQLLAGLGVGMPSAGAADAAAPPGGRLEMIPAAIGSAVHLVPVEEVLLLEAADKYVRVVTAEREYLIRTSLRELLPQLDPRAFWQVHRSTVVRVRAIEQAVRDEQGRIHLCLRGLSERPQVSRVYAHLFKAM